MKKNTLYFAIAALASSSLLFTGCSDDDTTGPDIILNGSDPMNISLNVTTSDPGATADDAEDGAVNVTSDWSSTNPNVNLKGTYTITYTAVDAAGNQSTAERTVNVVNDAEFLAGNYLNAYDSCQSGQTGTFNASVTTSNTVNNAFTINNFGGFGPSVNISGTRSSNTLSFGSSQSLGGGSSLISGSGSITSTASPVIFGTLYTWTDGASTEVCVSLYTK